MKTKNLILWVENLMSMVWEAYEPLDTDRAHFEEIKKRLNTLDEVDLKTPIMFYSEEAELHEDLFDWIKRMKSLGLFSKIEIKED